MDRKNMLESLLFQYTEELNCKTKELQKYEKQNLYFTASIIMERVNNLVDLINTILKELKTL